MSNKETALVPVEQKEVEFYGDEITAVVVVVNNTQQVYIPIRPICKNLGVDWSGQRQRINRDPVLSQYVEFVGVTPTKGEKRGNPNHFCLPLDYISGFLFGINANRVKSELRERLIHYQENCYKVLAKAFQEGHLTADPSFDDLLQSASADTLEAYQLALALVKLARNQILIEARLENNEVRLTDHEQRLEEIESTLGDPGRLVTPAQASQISQAVKAVAIAWGQQTERNEFGAVYGELYRKFEVTGYKQLPSNRFQACMDWLTEWHTSLTRDAPF
ncbi:MAG: hypothetical protein CSA11_01300 [Chloroflexi bacterium]|nr:MAG: hypothetical protein CSA11_01300 [Chloroflexota bacterium]